LIEGIFGGPLSSLNFKDAQGQRSRNDRDIGLWSEITSINCLEGFAERVGISRWNASWLFRPLARKIQPNQKLDRVFLFLKPPALHRCARFRSIGWEAKRRIDQSGKPKTRRRLFSAQIMSWWFEGQTNTFDRDLAKTNERFVKLSAGKGFPSWAPKVKTTFIGRTPITAN